MRECVFLKLYNFFLVSFFLSILDYLAKEVQI